MENKGRRRKNTTKRSGNSRAVTTLAGSQIASMAPSRQLLKLHHAPNRTGTSTKRGSTALDSNASNKAKSKQQVVAQTP